MATLYLAFLLHFYQPPGQLAGVLRRIADESYRPLLRLFEAHPTARATVNVNGVLTEMLDDHGHRDVIEGLARLAAAGQIEFTGSGKYHPILPLIAPAEAARQIALNDETNARLFGPVYRPRGFFPPEMAWEHALTPLVAASGKEWVILSGVACPVAWPLDRVHRTAAVPVAALHAAPATDGTRPGTADRAGTVPEDASRSAALASLAVVFRDDLLSNKIAFRSTDAPTFRRELEALAGAEDRYVVIAMDAETFGHHIPGWEEEFLGRFFRLLAEAEQAPARAAPTAVTGAPSGDALPGPERAAARAAPSHPASDAAPVTIRLVTVGDVVDRFPAGETVVPRPSSWSTTRDDLDHGNPYPLWRHRGNELHRLLWRHLEQALALLAMAARHTGPDGDADLRAARAFADIAQHSDQFWWASRRPHWSVNLVHRGLNMQRDLILNAVRAINLSDAPEDVRRESQERVAIARDLADRITDRLFWD
jgi:hypothetical protein